MKTCDRLREHGFHSIKMLEVRQRPFDGRKHPFETVDLGLDSRENGENVEGNGENVEGAAGNGEIGDEKGAKRQLVESDENSSKKARIDDIAESSSSSSKLENEVGNKVEEVEREAETEEARIEREELEMKQLIYMKRMANKYVLPTMPVKEVLIARPLSTMKGHTAFLTFAVRPPLTTPK